MITQPTGVSLQQDTSGLCLAAIVLATATERPQKGFASHVSELAYHVDNHRLA